MTRKYRLERTAFIGCRNTAYMDVDDAEPCPFCGSRQVTIYPYGQGTTSYVEGVPTLYLSSATCKCRGCTAEIDGPQRKSIIEGEDMDLIEGIELALEVNDPQGVHLSMSHDNGIDCAYIPINYCPICGRNFRKDR